MKLKSTYKSCSKLTNIRAKRRKQQHLQEHRELGVATAGSWTDEQRRQQSAERGDQRQEDARQWDEERRQRRHQGQLSTNSSSDAAPPLPARRGRRQSPPPLPPPPKQQKTQAQDILLTRLPGRTGGLLDWRTGNSRSSGNPHPEEGKALESIGQYIHLAPKRRRSSPFLSGTPGRYLTGGGNEGLDDHLGQGDHGGYSGHGGASN